MMTVPGPGFKAAVDSPGRRAANWPNAMFAVRAPQPAEANVISDLVLQSDCGMLPALFGSRVTALVAWLLLRPGNPYSSSNTLVVTDGPAGRDLQGRVLPDGVSPGGAPPIVIGAAVGSPVSTTRSASLGTAAQLAQWYGPAVIARLPRLARAGGAMDRLSRDDFYLSHIAVLPRHRGRGAGAALLRRVEDQARRLGTRRLLLDVEEHNDGARAFYARMGYRQESVVRIDLRWHGAFSFLRLVRDL